MRRKLRRRLKQRLRQNPNPDSRFQFTVQTYSLNRKYRFAECGRYFLFKILTFTHKYVTQIKNLIDNEMNVMYSINTEDI